MKEKRETGKTKKEKWRNVSNVFVSTILNVTVLVDSTLVSQCLIIKILISEYHRFNKMYNL